MLHWQPSTFTVFVITIVLFKSSANSDTFSSLLCPPDWIYIDVTDKCIKGAQILGSIDDNIKYCADLNASLVTIDSVEEDTEIISKLAALNILRFWISGNTRGYLTSSGEHRTLVEFKKSTSYTHWGPKSPHCSLGEKCCLMIDSLRYWHDVDCSDDLFLACEKRHIFESSEFNPSLTISDDIPGEDLLECSSNILQVILTPRNLSLLANMLADINNKTEADRTFLSETEADHTFLNETEAERNLFSKIEAARTIPKPKVNSVSSPSKPETSSLEPRPFVPSASPSTTSKTWPTSPSISTSTLSTSLPPASSSNTRRLSTSTEPTSVSSSPKPPVVTVSEELINHIIKKYQKNQLTVIRRWLDLVRTHRSSRERSRSISKPNDTKGFHLSNYLLGMLIILSILVLVATIITLLIITRRSLREKTQDTYQMSSRLLELGIAYD